MAYFNHVGTSSGGPAAFVTGITDLDVHWVNGTARLYVTTVLGGGVSVRAIGAGAGAGMAVLDYRAHSLSGVLAAPIRTELLDWGGAPFLAVSGRMETGLRGFHLTADGGLDNARTLTGPGLGAISALETVTADGHRMVVTAALDGGGLTSWSVAADGDIRCWRRWAAARCCRGWISRRWRRPIPAAAPSC